MGPAPAAAAAWPPIVVTRTGRPSSWRAPEAPAGAGGRGTAAAGRAARRPAPGRHRVEGRTGATTLVVAPGRCHLPPELDGGGRAWGWAAQLYAVRSRSSWGIGDLRDLAGLLAASAPGRRVRPAQPLARRPPGGAEPVQPVQPGVPQPAVPPGRGRARAGRSRPAGRGTGRGAGRRRPRPARPGPHRPAGRLPAQGRGPAPGPRSLDRVPGRRDGLAAYTAATGNLERYATFCALQHVHGNDWRDWPASFRHPAGPRWPPSAPSIARRSATTPGSSGCSTSSWRPPAGLQAARGGERPGHRLRLQRLRRLVVRTSWPPACRSAPRPTLWGRSGTGACRRSCPTGWPPAATARSPRPSGPAWPMPPACASTM